MTAAARQFEAGHTYTCRSVCDYDCVFSFEVTKRTAKTIWIKYMGRVTARRVRVVQGVECCDPHGRYSMSPVLYAGKL